MGGWRSAHETWQPHMDSRSSPTTTDVQIVDSLVSLRWSQVGVVFLGAFVCSHKGCMHVAISRGPREEALESELVKICSSDDSPEKANGRSLGPVCGRAM